MRVETYIIKMYPIKQYIARFIMLEVWLDIAGFQGLYQVSNYGRVKSFRRGGAKILKPRLNTHGYPRVSLSKKEANIHRLVALAFIPNPQNKLQINHIDGNKTNNCVNNLEWVSSSENMLHAYQTGLKKSPVGSVAKTTDELIEKLRKKLISGEISEETFRKLAGNK